MNIFEAILYGAVQGVTEYLPISSSAHLILLPRFLGEKDYGLSFDVFLHLGTFFATLVYFWSDWKKIFHSFKEKPVEEFYSWKVLFVATIPALLCGALLHKWIQEQLRENIVLMFTLSIGGILLFGVDRFSASHKSLKNSSMKDALLMGIAQCFALIPGVSRSGSTITAGRMLGFTRESSARFSFLMSGPVTLAAIVFEMRHWRELLQTEIGFFPLIVSGFCSFLFGMIAIAGLLKVVKKWSYLPFAVYRVLLGVLIYFVLS